MPTPASLPSPGPLLTKGLTAEIFAWSENRILKLFHPWMPRAKTEREFQIVRALTSIGVQTPAAFELIEHQNRLGIIFQRLEGISMFRSLQSKPWRLVSAARQLAGLHAHLHTFRAPPELPPQREQIQSWINAAADLTAPQLEAARQHLTQIPNGETLCHGDFHPENVFITPTGPVIIDWSTATRGDPILDVARTSSLCRHAEIPEDTPFHMRALIHLFRHALNNIYLNRYFQLRPGTKKQVTAHEPLQLAANSAWRTARVN